MKRIKPTTSNLLPYSAERTAALQSKPKHKKNTTTTNRLTNDIRDFIARHGGYSIRCNVSGFYRPELGGYIRSGSTLGTPDIIAVINGNFYGIEIKVGKDWQSPDQKAVQQGIEDAGGVYLLATDLDSFKATFQALIKPPFA
ncbi:VRR-NUC domain-containing protein [Runella slithyformis]|uniref:VRR-NUC domain-containing protein n=1 Tax=Runella slithyformis (strain ATCC 29530 / DSM 19594 / LMG 11500 / NCIMB 11436 / LSU 4) TaxID=761193 RepID=A0A7U3ZM40_RUNSL|nr:VRR-NUC domain-containing protein [Runella slithyformis]AEI49717.1 VRR-NUC domain-containing protein [Runella slithyformis DSM 19594]